VPAGLCGGTLTVLTVHFRRVAAEDPTVGDSFGMQEARALDEQLGLPLFHD